MQETFTDNVFGRTLTYSTTDTFPQGYVVWPIGRHNFPHLGFIPLARTTDVPFHIDLKGLLALRCHDEKEALYILKKAVRGDYKRTNLTSGLDRNAFQKLIDKYRKNQ